MKKVYYTIFSVALLAIVGACRTDDGTNSPDSIAPEPRDQRAIVDQEVIEEYLETHFYNYEEFESPTSDFDYKIRFDTIAGDNLDKIPLTEQVDFKMVKDREEDDVTYKLYYLKVRQGGGEPIDFGDVATLTFSGTSFLERTLNEGTVDEEDILEINFFDSAVTPLQLDLTQVVNGLQDAMIEFNTATQVVENSDGTLSFEDFGIGAVFAPSGLGYYTEPPPPPVNIPVYGKLIFTFHALATEIGDQDADNIPTIIEDRNGNGLEEDDDSDGDTLPDFLDNDDDNDLRFTDEEIETNEYILNPGDDEPVLAENEVEVNRETDPTTGVITISTVVFTDEDGDGIPDYLDPDS